MNSHPIELYIAAGGFFIVTAVLAVGWIDAWRRDRKEKRDQFDIHPRRRLFRDRRG